MDRAEAAAPIDWHGTVLGIIYRLSRIKSSMTTDDVWACAPGEPPEPRAMGPAMRNAQRAGWIERTSMTKQSKRPACHAREVRVWRCLGGNQQG